MSLIPANLYFRTRALFFRPATLRESSEPPPPSEKLLQQIWQYQRIERDRLQLLDGRQLRVLHPGFWNHEPGPDFRQAILQIDPQPPQSGDVEIDLSPHNWRSHNHDRNPDYQRVVLHVVWKADAQNPGHTVLPTLALAPFLDAPIEELQLWLGSDSAAPDLSLAGQCNAPLQNLSESEITELLRQAAHTRLQFKAAQMQARARQAGWEQALWEGVFSALGYKNNVWPMRRLAELIPLLLARLDRTDAANPATLQSLFLGIGGLLPPDLTRRRVSADDYLRRMWNCWWRERAEWSEAILPPGMWRLAGLRPANHPARRLALASHWVASGDFAQRLERWFVGAPDTGAPLLKSLLTAIQVENDPFWSHHWTFRSKPSALPQPLLGPQRATDLAMNVFLPWIWARASAGSNDSLKRSAEQRYFAWPRAEDNTILRQARRRLFGGLEARRPATAADQQGLLQIVHDFCNRSNALCENCPFPQLVRQITFMD